MISRSNADFARIYVCSMFANRCVTGQNNWIIITMFSFTS